MASVKYAVSSPDIGDTELNYVTQAVASGWVSSIGEFVDRFETSFASYCGVDHGVSMSNGTDALFIALKALGVGPGDEVIVPSLTFVAVPAVVLHLGAEPVIVDVHRDYWCLDPKSVERAITSRTKAIVVVHVYGHPADMEPIEKLAQPRGIRLVEDCAEAHGARYNDKLVGSIGNVGCFSFYGNKVITTGEGGMAITNDEQLANRMRFLKDHAMDPHRRYFHPEPGFNCRMTNIQAALGCAQLERIDELLAKRARILDWYREMLQGVNGLRLNPKLSWAEPVNWMVCAVLDSELSVHRTEILGSLRDKGIDTRPFFVPSETMPPYSSCRIASSGGEEGLPESRRLSESGFNLPSSSLLTREDVGECSQLLADTIESFR